MGSPFPGIDPFIEAQGLWPDLHHRLIGALSSALNEGLPETYAAAIGERVYVVASGRDLYPDVTVRRSEPRALSRGGAAAALPRNSEAPWVVTLPSDEVREGYVEVISLREGRKVLTAIEVLGPTNKALGQEGRRLYLRKQDELLQSRVSLLEIDLLQGGEHTVAVSRERLDAEGEWDHVVCLHRGWAGSTYELWPILLQGRLPWVRVPLGMDDGDVELDLQAAFERCYDEGAYARQIDYRAALPALDAARREWAAGLLRKRGLWT